MEFRRPSSLFLFFLTSSMYLIGNNVIADTITVKNGDTMTGSLIGLSGNIVSFKTTYAGTLFIKQSEVKHITTETPFVIIYSDEMRVTKTVSSEDSVATMDIIRSTDTTPLSFTSVWKRQLTISLDGTSGNSESQNFSMFGESTLRRTRTEHVVNISQTWERTEQKTTTNVLDVKYNFRWLRPSRWYNTVSFDFSRDRSKDVPGRAVFGFGGGKKFIEHSLTDLAVDVATSAVYQAIEEENEISPALRLGSTYNNKLFGGRVQLLQQTRLLWITESSEGVLDWLFGVKFLLSNLLNLDFRTSVKYETNPGANSLNLDLTYSFGVGSTF